MTNNTQQESGSGFITRHILSLSIGIILTVFSLSLVFRAFQQDSKGTLIQLEGRLESFSFSDFSAQSTSDVKFEFLEYPGRSFNAEALTQEDKKNLNKNEMKGNEFKFSVIESEYLDSSETNLTLYHLESGSYKYLTRNFESSVYSKDRLLGGGVGLLIFCFALWLLGSVVEHYRFQYSSSDELIIFAACHTRVAAAALLLSIIALFYYFYPTFLDLTTLIGFGASYLVFLAWFQYFGTQVAWIQREREIQASLKDRSNKKVGTEVPADIKLIQELITRDAVDTANASGLTPLHIACAAGRVEAIDLLLRNGASINKLDSNGRSPLIHAVIGNHLAVIMRLLDRYPNLQIADRTGATALDYAKANKKESIIQVLKNAAGRKSILHVAAAAGDVARVYQMIKMGMDANALNSEGQTALWLAVKKDSLGVVTQLLKLGANPNLANRDGMTPLQLAEKNKNNEIIQILLNPPPKEEKEGS